MICDKVIHKENKQLLLQLIFGANGHPMTFTVSSDLPSHTEYKRSIKSQFLGVYESAARQI